VLPTLEGGLISRVDDFCVDNSPVSVVDIELPTITKHLQKLGYVVGARGINEQFV
jgi:hypothetical protein